MENISKSSGNVFKDIAFNNCKELQVKSGLARQISIAIKNKNLKQREAEIITGVSQGDISKIMNGYCDRFSIERLFNMLTKLGQDIEINVHPSDQKEGHIFMQC